MQPETYGSQAVRRAKMDSDNWILVATFFVLFLFSSGYFIFTFIRSNKGLYASSSLEFAIGLLGALFSGLVIFVTFLLMGMVLVRMSRQMMLGNSLQVEYSNHAWLRDWASQVARDIDMPQVEIFITQNPVMNAYAFGFARPYCIVLHSGSIRYLTEDELKVIVIHEMAHIKYGHTAALVFLQPFISLPGINLFTSWITGFWQRRAELTSDRLALMYMNDGELVKKALTKIHVGPDVADAMNQTARDWLQYNAERPMNRFAQTFSSHPFLVRRLSHIDKYLQSMTPPAPVAQPTNPSVNQTNQINQ